MPRACVPTRYLNTCLTAFQCNRLGLCMNLQATPTTSVTLSRYYTRACRRGGTTGISNQEEMDVGKPTLSGLTALIVAQTGAVWDTDRKLPNTREGRERERESVCAQH